MAHQYVILTVLWMLQVVHSQTNLAVRLVGGSRPSTGIVEIFLNGQWGVMCSSKWTIIEADTVCRQVGYGGALTNEGVILEPFDQSGLSFLRGSLNCSTGGFAARGFPTLYGCERQLDSGDQPCDWPNGAACTRHQAELSVRLYGGLTSSAGRVEVFYGGLWWGICPEQWDLQDATVICKQLGFHDSKDGKHYKDSATVSYPKGHETRFYLMSEVNCTGEETNIGLCGRVYGQHTCASKDFATVTCAKQKTGRTYKPLVITTIICLLLIPGGLLALFLVVFCVYKKRKSNSSKEKSSNYTPVNEKEAIELS